LQTFKNAELLRRQGFEKLDTRIGAKIVDLISGACFGKEKCITSKELRG
jgi:hypothetical protein